MKAKKNYGWVRQITPRAVLHAGYYINASGEETKTIRKAYVWTTRKEAREANSPVYRLRDYDKVRKVSLSRTGKAKKVIGRG